MKQGFALLLLDLLRVKNWFRSYIGTKLLVFTGFTVVVASVAFGEFIMARTFFSFTATQAEFGRAVAQYSINAALLLLFILAIVSSITSSAGALYRPGFLRFLLTVPITSAKLFVARLTSALFHSIWVIVLLLTPLLIAYGRSFGVEEDFLLRAVVVLLILTLSSHAIGGILTVLLVKKTGRLSRKSLAVLFGIAIGGSLLLMRFLFPPAFFRLYYAEDWLSFQKQLGQLPLLSTSLPTNWLAKTITHTWSLETLAAALSTVGLLLLAWWVGKRAYLGSWRVAHEGRFLAGKEVPLKKQVTHFPKIFNTPSGSLLVNEFLAVTRSPAEATYAAFLTGLTVVLLFMMRSVPALEKAAPWLLPAVYALSLVGLSYLFMTLTARLVYPLMAKEKRTSWILFSIPVKREAVFNSKLAFALLIILPSFFLGVVAAWFLELPFTLLVTYSVILLETSVVVSLLQLLLGTISPNFAESENLEATSTSGSGLAAITLSLIFIGISGFTFYKVAIGATAGAVSIGAMTLLAVVWIGSLYWLAHRALHRYDL